MYVDVPERNLLCYVAINPQGPISFASSTPTATFHPPPDGVLDPSKPLLVFLHAPTCSTASFSRQFADARLRSVANLVGVDARLHGRTEAECVQAVLDKLGYARFFLFGEGVLGCRTASWLAIRRPEKVLGIILASPAFPVEKPNICAQLEDLGQELCVNKVPDGTGACRPEALEGIASYFFGDDKRQTDRKEEFKLGFEKRYGAGFPAIETLSLASYGRREPIPAAQLARVRCPVLILSGGGDRTVSPPEACEAWQRAFVNAQGGARISFIASAPHLMSWSDSNVVNRIAAQFVSQHVAPPAQ